MRSAMSSLTKRWRSACFSTSVQSNQEISLFWQNALLFPPWVRRTSSPISSIGVPVASKVNVKKFLT